MKTPSWWQRRNITAALLLPLSLLMLLAGRLAHFFATPRTLSVPVLCVGNAVAGGSGKTPVALTLARLTKELGYTPHFLSRGYGGKLHDAPCRVTGNHTAAEVGDEALLLARDAPCWIAADRAAAAEEAITAGASLLIMDDGLQNPTLHKTLPILVVSGGTGFGNGWLIPAGPLREPLADAFNRVQAIILVGEDRHQAGRAFPKTMPVFTGHLEPVMPLADLPQPVLAFAGLGYPEKFFTMLRGAGVTMAATRAFPDHHPYSDQDRRALREEAAQHGAQLVTTAKDAVKWPEKEQQDITVVDVTFRFTDEPAFTAFLRETLHAAA